MSVAAVHVIAIALYYAIDLPHASPREQRVFAWTWMAVTVAIVFVGLHDESHPDGSGFVGGQKALADETDAGKNLISVADRTEPW